MNWPMKLAMIELFYVKDNDKYMELFPMITRDKIIWRPMSGCKLGAIVFFRGIWSVDFRSSDHDIKWPKIGAGQRFT